jgi:hypothetical protein
MSNPASNYQARPHGAGSLIVTRPIVPAPLRKPDTAAVLTGGHLNVSALVRSGFDTARRRRR